MKKETKKKVFNFVLATSIVASIVTPLAIVLGKESNSLLIGNKNTKEIGNVNIVNSSNINDDFTLDLSSALGNNKNISLSNPNVARAIPGGYVVVSGDSNNKHQQVVCLDKNDPTKELWKLSLNNNGVTDVNVYGIEYTPYDNGTLCVLYSVGSDSFSTNNTIKVNVYNNLNSTPKFVQTYSLVTYSNSSHTGNRLDTWAITPVYNFQKQVTKYFVYCKQRTQIHEIDSDSNKFYLVDIENKKHTGYSIDPWKSTYQNKKIILSVAAFYHEGNSNYLSLVPLFIEKESGQSKLKIGFYKESNNSFTGSFTNNVDNINFNFDDENKNALIAKSSINSIGFSKKNTELKIAFSINVNNGNNFNIPHRKSAIIIATITSIGNSPGLSPSFIKKSLFKSNSYSNENIETELWNGYFSNEVITKHGLNVTSSNPTSFVGLSYHKSDNISDWILSVIKDPFDNNSNYEATNDLDNSSWRIYRVNGSDDSKAYKDWSTSTFSDSLDSNKQLNFNQGTKGIPLLEYNDEKENNDVFNRNILFTKNGAAKAIVINQKDRGQSTKNLPSYAYWTRLKNDSKSFSYTELGINSNDFTKLNKEDIKTRIQNNLLINNIKNSTITFEKLFFDYENGQIIFTLKVNNYFNQQGQLKTDSNLKFEDITIFGFTPIKYEINQLQNLYNAQYLDYQNRNSSVFIANEIVSHNSETNLNLYWSLREIVWRLVTATKFGFNLKKQIEFGSNQQTTRNNFKQFFNSFSWTKSNNKEGKITASFSIKKDYLYVDESQEDKVFSVTFSGLRKIEDTKLKPNTKENAITDSALSSFNIPNSGSVLDQNHDYLAPETKVITEDNLKELFIEKIFKPYYKKATNENGFSTGVNDLVDNLAYNANLSTQNLNNPSTKSEWLLTKNDIVLSNYDFLAGEGILSVEIRLNFWNKDGQLQKVGLDQIIENAPSARWYVSGFRKDNVETKFNQNEVWELEGLEDLSIDQLKKLENKDRVQSSLSNYLMNHKNLVELPFWINPDIVLSNPSIEYDLNSIELDVNNSRQATLKVRLKNNMWVINKETGKVENKQDNLEYQIIKISGFLDPTPIKLKSEWLKQIQLSGNTKNLNILSEDEVFKNVIENERKFLKIEYTVEGLDKWFDKESFKSKLEQLDGSLNDENWIIKREDIKARFAYVGSVFIEIDDKIINSSNPNVGISIIDSNNNNEVKGYINIDKISNIFATNNFEVHGTNKNPKLIIKNFGELNVMLSRYSSNNIFEILYSNSKNNFDSNNAIWKSGMSELKNTNDLKLEITNYFALCFKATSDYQVYKNGLIQNNGYILESPGIKLFISIEIINPLVNQKIEINFKDENGKPKFFQNEGGLSVKVNSKTFDDFIKNDSKLEEDKQKAIELAYYVSNRELKDEEIIHITSKDKLYEEQTDQKYNNWKTLETNLPDKDLNLLVNDYVIIAIRVKKEFLISEENKKGYLIKEDSSYLPTQSRVYGYKIKTNDIKINLDSIKLENVGQAELASYALDGYARLKHLSLVEDENKNYLGAQLKINYFNDFYKDKNNKILISGSNQVLVKREKGSSSKEYKDENGNLILDSSTNQSIKLELDKDSKPNRLIQNQTLTNSIELEEYFANSFRMSKQINPSELKYNFFQNQEIEFELVNKKGSSPEGEFDYYVDVENVKTKYTFKDIKFPINNDSNIRYEFDLQFVQDIFNPNNLNQFYANSLDSTKQPFNGQTKIKKSFSIIRKENNRPNQTITTLEGINSVIENDFKGQIKLIATHSSIDGKSTVIEDGDITKINNLKNGDRFKVEIVSTSNDLIFAQQSNPLIFTVLGLYEQPIDEEFFKYLRVKQGGIIDGQGSFNILVDDPNQSNSNSDLKSLLNGYKFLVRVWDVSKKVKHEWTENFISINNLKNGDKVEWKLVSPNGSPLVDSYYNTVANLDKHNVNENKYSFIQINQEGFAGKNVSEPKEGIGKTPENVNEYPSQSGLLISGLKPKDDSSYTTITFEEFTRVMNLMNFGYSGINGSGNMISSKNALDIELNVVGRNSETFTLDYLLKNNYISFYYNNDSSSQLNSFNWDQVKDEKGNWLTSPGTLSNGDSVRIVYKDPTMSTSYEYYAPIVSGLQNKSDNMSMFSWIGIGLASFATLGIFAFIYLYVRNRKLK